MKKTRGAFFITFLFVCASLALTSCNLFFSSINGKTTGSLTLRIAPDPASAARTLRPSVSSLKVVTYSYSLVGPGGATASGSESTGSKTFSDLATGEWTVTVSAKNADGVELMTGSAKLTIATGQTVNATVNLVAASGSGSVSLIVNVPSSVASVSGTIKAEPSGTATAIDASKLAVAQGALSYADSLAAGSYLLTLTLKDAQGATVGMLIEEVDVFANLSTTKTVTVTAASLDQLPAAPAAPTAVAGDGSVTLGITSIPGATGYNVYYKANSSAATVADTKAPGSPFASLSPVISGLQKGLTYAFVVTAVNLVGEGPASPAATAVCAPTVGLVTDINGINDGSFTELAWEGLQSYATEYGMNPALGVVFRSSASSADFQPNFDALAAAGRDLVIGAGYQFNAAMAASAAAHPSTKYLLLDSAITDSSGNAFPNVAGLMFAAQEGSFLVGVAAGLQAAADGKNMVGFIGGMKNPGLEAFQAGFEQGVKAVNPGCSILIDWAGSFTNPASGQLIAKAQYGAGCDVIYVAAGGTGQGVIDEAKSRSASGDIRWVIGADVDQYSDGLYAAGKSVVLTSMQKRVDLATHDIAVLSAKGQFPGGQVLTYGLGKGGVGIPDVNPNLGSSILSQISSYASQIVAGTRVISDTPQPGSYGVASGSTLDPQVPDIGLRLAMAQAVGNTWHTLTASDLAALTTLGDSAGAGQGIRDLTGVNLCTGLQYAYFRNNGLSDLAPLASCQSLLSLEVRDNPIPYSNLSSVVTTVNFPNLQRLRFSGRANGVQNVTADEAIALLSSIATVKNIALNRFADLDDTKFSALYSQVLSSSGRNVDTLYIQICNVSEASMLKAIELSSVSDLSFMANPLLTSPLQEDIDSMPTDLSRLLYLQLGYGSGISDLGFLQKMYDSHGAFSGTGAEIDIQGQGLDLRQGTANRGVIDYLVNKGVTVDYTTGNTTQ